MSLKEWLFGRALATEEDRGQRVGPLAGVPILGLDALASAAYGPEALLTVLLPLGTGALGYMTSLTLLTLGLLLILFLSYRQTIDAYPNGGGAYAVAKENLGERASLLAAAALALDYLLNVAVAISAGIGALVSAIPSLLPHTLLLCLCVLILLTFINLRGVRESGVAFLVPTYLFICCLFVVLGAGLYQTLTHGGMPTAAVPLHRAPALLGTASIWLLCRAFASGCTAMTGVEALSNGVPIFREPKEQAAKRTLTLVIAILATLLLGIAVLARAYRITATSPGASGYESVLSQLVAAVVGRGAFYYLTLSAILAVLSLSANTSFAGFPRLCRLLAQDKFLPEPFLHRGRRLALSHGIILLSMLSGLLLVVFRGVTDALIPLFAIGALLAFTMSQAGMVVHWQRRGNRARSLLLNAFGALSTGAAGGIVVLAKFREGAWVSLLLIAALLMLFRQIRGHYEFVDRATATPPLLELARAKKPVAVLPVRRWDAVAAKGLSFALGLDTELIVVQVLTDEREVDDLTERWDALTADCKKVPQQEGPKLVVVRSRYRTLFEPLSEFLAQVTQAEPDRQVAVIIPELVERRWFQYFLHSQSASILKALLLLRGSPQLVIVSVPWYLRDWVPERTWLSRFHWLTKPSPPR